MAADSLVLCIANEAVSLCHVAHHKGCCRLQEVQVTKYDTKQELSVALGNFSPKKLKKVRVIVVALPWVRCLPLEVFFAREEHFWQSAVFELKQTLGEDFSAFEIELYRTDGRVNAFLFEKKKLILLRGILAQFGIKKAKFISSTAAFLNEIPHTESRICWSSFIADEIEATCLEPIEPLLPAIFTAVASHRNTATYRSINVQATSRGFKRFFRQKECVVGVLCLMVGLLFCVQHLGGVEREWDERKQELVVHRDQLSKLAQQIDQAQQRLLQKQDLLGDVVVYDQQNHAWNVFFSQLQTILFQTGDVFLTDFQWRVAISPQDAPTKNSSKKRQLREKPAVNDSLLEKVPASIELAGAIFIENSQDSGHWNAPMNQMFDALRKIAEVDDICEIKVNAPTMGKITFRCRLRLKPDAELLAI
ncbi:MAG: hypothetical protein LW808_002905 [Verrucomicrobiota bacterium]|nr:MAG: hypothetical protein LW808_002905 [Verrucomicrobiota bacterium]